MSNASKRSAWIAAVFVIAALALVACTPAVTPAPIPTPAHTATPAPTITPAPTPTPAPTLESGDTERAVTVDGLPRDYILYIPPGLDSSQMVPVVFAFHYYPASGLDMQNLTGFNAIADTGGFVVVYPNGIDGSWNAGSCCGLAVENNVDESAFVREILADLGTIVSIDAKRIYAMGNSNGGMLSYRLACEMSDTFAAIAPVQGIMWQSPCEPTQPVSVLHVHGVEDSVVPYAGGESSSPDVPRGLHFPSVEQSITTWAQLDGCTNSAQVDEPGQIPIKHTVYTSCRAGTAVELYAIEIMGHFWPETYVLPISQVTWDFFAAHPKP